MYVPDAGGIHTASRLLRAKQADDALAIMELKKLWVQEKSAKKCACIKKAEASRSSASIDTKSTNEAA